MENVLVVLMLSFLAFAPNATASDETAAPACVQGSVDPPGATLNPESCRAYGHRVVDYVFNAPALIHCLTWNFVLCYDYLLP